MVLVNLVSGSVTVFSVKVRCSSRVSRLQAYSNMLVSLRDIQHEESGTTSRRAGLLRALVDHEGGPITEEQLEHTLSELESSERQLRVPDNLKSCQSSQINIWWAGKPLVETSERMTLGDYIGWNEKTKVTVTIQQVGTVAPSRLAQLDQETYRNLLTYHNKRLHQLRCLEDDEDDSYLNSIWSDPRALKRSLLGSSSDLKFKLS